MANRIVRTLLVLAVPTVILGSVATWQGTVHWWKKGYSKGTRTGILRKVSLKGTPVCRFVSIEMLPYGSVGSGAASDVFEFTLDDWSEEDPLYKQMQQAERKAKPITIEYRQDLHKWWWRDCVTTEYYATAIVTADDAPAAAPTPAGQPGVPNVPAAPTGAGLPSQQPSGATAPGSPAPAEPVNAPAPTAPTGGAPREPLPPIAPGAPARATPVVAPAPVAPVAAPAAPAAQAH